MCSGTRTPSTTTKWIPSMVTLPADGSAGTSSNGAVPSRIDDLSKCFKFLQNVPPQRRVSPHDYVRSWRARCCGRCGRCDNAGCSLGRQATGVRHEENRATPCLMLVAPRDRSRRREPALHRVFGRPSDHRRVRQPAPRSLHSSPCDPIRLSYNHTDGGRGATSSVSKRIISWERRGE